MWENTGGTRGAVLYQKKGIPLTPGPLMVVSPAEKAAPFHQHMETWSSQVHGRKLWILSPPTVGVTDDQLDPCSFDSAEFGGKSQERDLLWYGILILRSIHGCIPFVSQVTLV